MLATYIRHIWVCSILITLSSDTEKNPGPKPSSCDKFSICLWNQVFLVTTTIWQY